MSHKNKNVQRYTFTYIYAFTEGFPGGSEVKNLPSNAGDTGDVSSIPERGRSHGAGNGKPHQYSCPGNQKTEESGKLQSIGHKQWDTI